MKTEYKNKQINLRLTEKEYFKLKEKAVNYPTLSSYILDACLNFDDDLGIKRLEKLRLWSEDFTSFQNEIIRISNNVNQLAHYTNNLKLIGVLLPGVVKEIIQIENDYNLLMTEILNSNMNFKKCAKSLLSR